MNIQFESEFSEWLNKQKPEYLDATSTEEILKKYISTAFLGNHYMKMVELITTVRQIQAANEAYKKATT